MKSINGIDLLKFIMAMLIVGVHSCIYEQIDNKYLSGIVNVVTGLCVPIFFIITAFFFFFKLRKLANGKDRLAQLMRFEKRTFFLYLFWLIVQLPYVIYIQKYDVSIGLPLEILRDMFFGHTFVASWFLGAMMVGMPVVFILHKNKIIGGSISFIICMLYLYLYQYSNLPHSFQIPYLWWQEHFSTPILSFWRGMFWMMIGYYCSSSGMIHWIERLPMKFIRPLSIVCITISPFFLSEYVSIPLSILLFMGFYKLSLKESTIYRKLRLYSIIIYCSHGTMLSAISFILRLYGMIQTILAIVACIALAEMVFRLSKHKRLGFLKYAY